MDNVELLILRSLLYNEDYARKVVPFIQGDYFEQPSQKITFEEIATFITDYDELPSKEALYIEVEKRNDVTEELYKQITELIGVLDDSPSDEEWLGGFFCPCHGSKFDLAGRVYKGVPAPVNLEVPPHSFDGDTLIIGEPA